MIEPQHHQLICHPAFFVMPTACLHAISTCFPPGRQVLNKFQEFAKTFPMPLTANAKVQLTVRCRVASSGASVCDVPQNWQPVNLLPASILHPALWARWDPSTSGFRYVWIETELSRAVGEFCQWNFEKLPQTRYA